MATTSPVLARLHGASRRYGDTVALDDFDLMYDITMQMLVGKPVVINVKGYDGATKSLYTKFVVTDRHMDLRGVPELNENPVVVVWLTKLVSEYLRKKYPRPSLETLPATSLSRKERKQRKQKERQS